MTKLTESKIENFAIKRYHAKVLTAAEVMDELINISKEIVKSDKQAAEMGKNRLKSKHGIALCLPI